MWRGVNGEATAEMLSAALQKEADAGGAAFEARRWFLDDTMLIRSGGKTWVFTKMWGERTKEIMCTWIAKYPSAGIKVTRAEG
jgi:hypothetical protein